MGITYRGDGPWGPGKGSDLNPSEVDGNFWELVQDVAAKAVQGVGIANFQVIGDQMTVVLTDHTLVGPYTLPQAEISFEGEWQPHTQYFANQIVTNGGTTYIVLANHESALTFDPGANNGAGQDYYGILLQSPASTLPTGGVPGMVLAKATTTDFATLWEWLTLAGLTDVDQTNSPHSGDLIYWNGAKFSYLPQASINAAAQHFANLADVLASPSPSNGDLVSYNGTAFTYLAAQTITGGVNLQLNSNTLAYGQPLVFDQTVNAFTNVSKVDLPCWNNGNVSGTTTLDRANGEIQRISLGGDTTLALTGWPAFAQFGRLVVRIDNFSGHALTWPTGVGWPGGIPPRPSTSGTDVVIFISFDGGSNIHANIVGQNYS